MSARWEVGSASQLVPFIMQASLPWKDGRRLLLRSSLVLGTVSLSNTPSSMLLPLEDRDCRLSQHPVHLCNVEPGGVKTKYATSSLKMMEERHPAYGDPSYPTNALLSYMTDPKSRETWAEPGAVAAAMYKIVSRGERIPIRVPLGVDAWSMIMADIRNVGKELEEMKKLSESVVPSD